MVEAPPAQNVFLNRYMGETAVGGFTAIPRFVSLSTCTASRSRSPWPRHGAITGTCNVAFLLIVLSHLPGWPPQLEQAFVAIRDVVKAWTEGQGTRFQLVQRVRIVGCDSGRRRFVSWASNRGL